MAASAIDVDFSLLGGRELQRKFVKLERQVQVKIGRTAIRNSAKRTKKRIIRNISGRLRQWPGRRGVLLAAFKKAKIKSASYRRGFIRIGVEWPTRADFGISAGDKDFWPAAVEYGHARARAHPFMRPAIDEYKRLEFRRIGRDFGREIERRAGR